MTESELGRALAAWLNSKGVKADRKRASTRRRP